MVRRLIAIATLALAGSTALGVTAAAAQPTGGDGTVSIRLTEVPTDQAEDPRANHYVVASALPGTSLTRTVEVRNGSSDSTAVRLYAGGASVVDGEFSFMAGEGGNDLASWTTVAPATLRLAPGEAGTATVTVAVPAGAAGGERYAVV
ncbi:MAG TPA: hypothetical protein VM618_06225, partial [Acidimicrobiia bacterium]|nr:hypothetical protein [Acidimicrobiia bacterium]